MDDLSKYAGRYENALGDGDVIVGEGPGKGFLSIPWILPDYLSPLGLNPTEYLLASWLIRYSWENKGVVFPSTPKLARKTNISEKTLYKHLDGLEQKGYINRIPVKTPINDRRIRRGVYGLFSALAFAARCNPDSKYCMENPQENAFNLIDNSPEFFRDLKTPKEVNDYYIGRGLIFDWSELTPDLPIQKRRKNYHCICIECESMFTAGNPNAIRCPNCKQKMNEKRFESFLSNRNEFEGMLGDAMEVESQW